MKNREINEKCIFLYRFSDMGAEINCCRIRSYLNKTIYWTDPPCKICKIKMYRENILDELVKEQCSKLSDEEKKIYLDEFYKI